MATNRGTGVTGKTRAELDLEVRLRESEIIQFRIKGLAFDQIADRLDYADESSARKAYARALGRTASADVEQWREGETVRLQDLMTRLYAELDREHVVVQFGKVVPGPDGQPLRDSGAVVAIIREIRQLSAELSKLRGLHAPMRVQVEEIPEDFLLAEVCRINEMADRVIADLESKGVDVSDLKEPEVPDAEDEHLSDSAP